MGKLIWARCLLKKGGHSIPKPKNLHKLKVTSLILLNILLYKVRKMRLLETLLKKNLNWIKSLTPYSLPLQLKVTKFQKEILNIFL